LSFSIFFFVFLKFIVEILVTLIRKLLIGIVRGGLLSVLAIYLVVRFPPAADNSLRKFVEDYPPSINLEGTLDRSNACKRTSA